MTDARRVLIVGASLAGLTAAEALRAEGFVGEILILGEEDGLPYARPPLSKQVLSGEWPPERATLRSGAELEHLGLEVRSGTRAVELDVPGRRVFAGGGWLPYDTVIIATGVAARALTQVPGGRTALTLRTREDAIALRRELARAGRVIVIGSGVLGSEIASTARKGGHATVLAGRSESLSFGSVGRLLGPRLAELHRANGVCLGVAHELEPDGTDLMIAAIGGVPQTEWLRRSGLSLEDGVRCDSQGRAAPYVFAIGDVAAWADPITGLAIRVEHQTNAIEQALSVAHTIVTGESSGPPAPFFWSELHGTRIQAYGSFDQRVPLVRIDGDADRDRHVLASISHGKVAGVVGWNAAKRFRDARTLVDQTRRSGLSDLRVVPHRKDSA